MPILLTLFGISTLTRPLQPQNASLPILITVFGMVILVSLSQYQNAPSAIACVPSSITISEPPGISPLYSKSTFPAYTRPLGLFSYHSVPTKALSPILITLFGISISDSTPHDSKALCPILFTPSPITTFNRLLAANARDPISSTLPGIPISLKALQLEKASSPIYLTPYGISTLTSSSKYLNALSAILTVPSLITTSVPLGISPLYL